MTDLIWKHIGNKNEKFRFKSLKVVGCLNFVFHRIFERRFFSILFIPIYAYLEIGILHIIVSLTDLMSTYLLTQAVILVAFFVVSAEGFNLFEFLERKFSNVRPVYQPRPQEKRIQQYRRPPGTQLGKPKSFKVLYQ